MAAAAARLRLRNRVARFALGCVLACVPVSAVGFAFYSESVFAVAGRVLRAVCGARLPESLPPPGCCRFFSLCAAFLRLCVRFCACAFFRIFCRFEKLFSVARRVVRIFFWSSGLAGAARGACLNFFEWAFRPRRVLFVSVCRVPCCCRAVSCCCVLWCVGVYVVVGVVLCNFSKSCSGF